MPKTTRAKPSLDQVIRVRVERPVLARLVKTAAQVDRPVSYIVRTAIDNYLEQGDGA